MYVRAQLAQLVKKEQSLGCSFLGWFRSYAGTYQWESHVNMTSFDNEFHFIVTLA